MIIRFQSRLVSVSLSIAALDDGAADGISLKRFCRGSSGLLSRRRLLEDRGVKVAEIVELKIELIEFQNVLLTFNVIDDVYARPGWLREVSADRCYVVVHVLDVF